LAISLIENGKIVTTEAKAKEMRPYVERLVTKAKSGGLVATRLITSKVGSKAAKILVEKIAANYKERKGGYTRVVKLTTKRGDAASMAQIEFV
jgi:large subunit ribosomal protein L17